jgi:pimeloyl-ACP methyl ester carboxylesterase
MVSRQHLVRCIFVLYVGWSRLLKDYQRRWWQGLFVTLKSVVLANVERLAARKSGALPPAPRQALEIGRAPFIGGVQTFTELIECNGESYSVWWSGPPPGPAAIGAGEKAADEQLWVVLPGGMASGDAFYVHDAITSGVFGQHRWCVFHNPGIVSRCVAGAPPALTDTTYISHFITAVLPRRGMAASLMGFSAGSMLAICTARRFSDLKVAAAAAAGEEKAEAEAEGGVGGGERDDHCGALRCCVAIHGPDSIRGAFAALKRTYRLDVPFALGVYTTMVNSGCPRFLPAGRGGGLHLETWRSTWLDGWDWMQRYMEAVWGRPWREMEGELWSCTAAMRSRLAVPTLRVLAEDDPVISYEDCVDAALLGAFDEVVVQPSGGHCAAFRADPALAVRVAEWASRSQ